MTSLRTLSIACCLALAAALTLVGSVAPAQEYVGSESCAGCHTKAYDAWKGSHHALAWTAPTAENIVADFDGTEFHHDGMTARFRVDPDGGHHVSVTEKDGIERDYPVHSVAGIEPLQQYLLETEPGRLQSFDVVWDTVAREWFHLYPDQDLPPSDGLHWTGPYKTWNARCAECHATGYRKNYDQATKTYASSQVEIGVGCEACHGPGAEHLAWAGTFETTRSAPPANYGFAVDFADRDAALAQCAGCHSRREAHLDGNPPPGTAYDDAYNLALLRPGLYHADGQILDEVYVYGSFLQSKMYARGVGCGNCHEPHAAETVADGNAVCTQCHSPAGNPDFPSLREADYDDPSHHFHPAGSEGAQCRNCHMIERTYMGVDGRRDHSFRVPRPDLARETGAPDACTDCHEDRTATWAAAAIADWYPDSTHRGPHFGSVLARGRMDAAAASGDLSDLALDAGQPGLVRATAAWLLEQSGNATVADRLEPLLDDPDPLVRASAIGVQALAPPQARVLRVIGLLDDPERNVRMTAASALLNAPVARMPGATEAQFRDAIGEWRAAMGNRMDFPETHLQLGGWALTMRNLPAAEAAFRETVRMDPQRGDAWIMIARILAITEGEDAAAAALGEGLAANPDNFEMKSLAAELAGERLPMSDFLPPPQ